MTNSTASTSASSDMRRELGILGAVMMGMGSIVGTGVFVSIGIGAGIAGPAVILGIILAAGVATCNGLSSAQLAASHPVSGGTYEYGYKYLNGLFGFMAGWMFLCAKSASAATAALGFSGYFLNLFGINDRLWQIGIGLVAVFILTMIVMGGIRRSNFTNMFIVAITLTTLIFFIVGGLPGLLNNGVDPFIPFFVPPSAGASPIRTIFHASALMFVAYTGYGRIATLGEEVREPRRIIPRAVIITLIATMLLYSGVGIVAIGNVGVEEFARMTTGTAAPLEIIANGFAIPGAGWVLAAGAIMAMLGVLLNLLLGLSRVLLAMGRRRDMPRAVAQLNKQSSTPETAVVVIGILIALLVLIGDIRITWSFSAFTVLIYYAITNLAALQLPPEKRLYPAVVSMTGLLACLFLAFWVEPAIWISGIGLLVVGLGWKYGIRRLI